MRNTFLDKVYRDYHKELYLYLLSLCKNHHSAEELVSETFVRALVSIKEPNGKIKYYLFRIGRNLWIDEYRKKNKKDEQTLYENNLKIDENALSTLIKNEKNKKLYKAILSLKDSYKEVIILFYFCGFTQSDISRSLNISIGSVRTLLYRSRKKLKEILEGEDYEF